jgi:hypothetical protein
MSNSHYNKNSTDRICAITNIQEALTSSESLKDYFSDLSTYSFFRSEASDSVKIKELEIFNWQFEAMRQHYSTVTSMYTKALAISLKEGLRSICELVMKEEVPAAHDLLRKLMGSLPWPACWVSRYDFDAGTSA